MKTCAIMFTASLAMVLLGGCSGRDGEVASEPCDEPNVRYEGKVNIDPEKCNRPLPPAAAIPQQSNNVSTSFKEPVSEVAEPQRPMWRFERIRHYYEVGVHEQDFRVDASLETVNKIADEIEHEILAADLEHRISGMWEYLTLAAIFDSRWYGRVIDDQTWRVVRERESFETWSNRVVVSYAFLQRMLEFGRKYNFTDDAGYSAERYRMSVSELREFADNGQAEYVAVLKPCVEKLGDELDREDSVLKKGYDYYRSFCPTDEDAKPMLKAIIRKMGRRPKWAKKED